MAQVIGASIVIVLPCTSIDDAIPVDVERLPAALPGVSPFMPTASIQSWLPMRRTITVSPGLKPRADATLKLRAPTGT